jgi:iron complex outermembrane receptor protein
MMKSISWGIPVALASFSMLGQAQTPPATTKDVQLQEVVVTGSLLQRDVSDVAQPMVILQTDDLLKMGATNPEQMLQQIAQNQQVTVSTTSIGAGQGGGAYANLRSLGSERTLVLLNGKRLVNDPYQTVGVDLNTVPMALVERIEVLADGGSATYGTDAIAGVVNFITAKELRGLNVSATATTPQKGGGQAYLGNVSGGLGSLNDDGWNVYAGANYRKAFQMVNTERSFSATGLVPSRGVDNTQEQGNPANYTQPGIANDLYNPSAPGCKPPYSLYNNGSRGAQACTYDVLALNNISFPQEQWSVLAKGSLRLGDNNMFSVEYVRGDSKLTTIVSPRGVGGLQMPPNSPYYPGRGIIPGNPAIDPTQPITFSWRTEELGRRAADVRSYTDRALAQLEGQLGAWDYQLYAMISNSTVKVLLDSGYPNETLLHEGFMGTNGAPYLNPFGPQDAAGSAFLQSIVVTGQAQQADGKLKVYGGQLNGKLFNLPGGPVQVAFAAEYKKDDASFTNNFAVTDLIPSTFSSVVDTSGNRNSKSVAFEANLPILKNLDVGIAARYDNYSDFGSTTNPQFTIRYKPAEWLTLRGSYTTSFRAPTLYNLFQPKLISYTDNNYNDPVLCPNGVVNTAAGGIANRDCNATIDKVVGGNANLQPETADTYSLGFVLKPVASLSIGVDYWNYHLKHTISEFPEAAIFANPNKYAALLFRCSQLSSADQQLHTSCTYGGGGDPIAYIQTLEDNLGDTKTSGFDMTLDWRGPRTSIGTFGVQYRATYVSTYDYQNEPGGIFYSRAGQYLDNSAVLRYVHFLTLSWNDGPLTLQLLNRFKSPYTDCNAQCGIDPKFFNTVASFSTTDFSATYQWGKHLTVFGTVGNIFNKAPPFTNGSSGLSNNWDDRYADARLRYFLLTVSYTL